MDCENEKCPLCHGLKIMGKEYVMKDCLHTICEKCHLKNDKPCPRCPIKCDTKNRKFEDSPSE